MNYYVHYVLYGLWFVITWLVREVNNVVRKLFLWTIKTCNNDIWTFLEKKKIIFRPITANVMNCEYCLLTIFMICKILPHFVAISNLGCACAALELSLWYKFPLFSLLSILLIFWGGYVWIINYYLFYCVAIVECNLS